MAGRPPRHRSDSGTDPPLLPPHQGQGVRDRKGLPPPPATPGHPRVPKLGTTHPRPLTPGSAVGCVCPPPLGLGVGGSARTRRVGRPHLGAKRLPLRGSRHPRVPWRPGRNRWRERLLTCARDGRPHWRNRVPLTEASPPHPGGLPPSTAQYDPAGRGPATHPSESRARTVTHGCRKHPPPHPSPASVSPSAVRCVCVCPLHAARAESQQNS